MSSSAGGAYLPGDPPPSTGAVITNPIINAAPIPITASLTLSAAVHDHRFIVVNAAAGLTITLPPASGSGAIFNIVVGVTLTSNTLVVKVANVNDYMRGFGFTLSGATASTFATANTGTPSTESDTITFNRTTTGLGTIGDFIELVDMAPNVWAVEADYDSSGTAATPFSVGD